MLSTAEYLYLMGVVGNTITEEEFDDLYAKAIMGVSKGAKAAPETSRECVKRLMSRGGFIIVVGGEMGNLPARYTTHPQVRVWDDNDQDWVHRKIPTNTRGIVFNSWISHQKVSRLRNAAKQLGIPIFPFLKTREVKELLDYITDAQPVLTEATGEIELPQAAPVPETGEVVAAMKGDDNQSVHTDTSVKVIRKPRRGEMTNNILPDLDIKDTETPAQAANRLAQVILGMGYDMSYSALEQAVRQYKVKKAAGHKFEKITYINNEPDTSRRKPAYITSLSQANKGVQTLPTGDEFAEGERLLREAHAAIQLFIDYLPRLRAKHVELLETQNKMRQLLGGK